MADESESGWSRFVAFPIMLAAIFALLWRGRRSGRALVPDVALPRVFDRTVE